MAAGLGFKTFNTGDVLTASEVNGYLMQGILVFADATARDAAITSPQEGQFAFTKDNNSLWYYSGSAWVASGATGDIEGVTAGTGISGGGTSGTVTITNSMATAIDAKGDLIVGTGADTFDRLAVGTNGHTLVADSAEATGLKWQAPAGGGKVLQVVQGSKSTQTTTSSSSFGATGLEVTITPSSSNSKILVLVSIQGVQKYTGDTQNAVRMQLNRSGVGSTISIDMGQQIGYTNSNLANDVGSVSTIELDTPATTNALTYFVEFRTAVNGYNASINTWQVSNTVKSTITVMEIGA
jgi:hypothetical protein